MMKKKLKQSICIYIYKRIITSNFEYCIKQILIQYITISNYISVFQKEI